MASGAIADRIAVRTVCQFYIGVVGYSTLAAAGTRMPSRRPSSASFSLHFVERGLAEVANFEQLIFVAAPGRGRCDVLRFQAVGRPAPRASARPGSCSASIRSRRRCRRSCCAAGGVHPRAQLAVLHERIQVLAENLGRLDQRHFRWIEPLVQISMVSLS